MGYLQLIRRNSMFVFVAVIIVSCGGGEESNSNTKPVISGSPASSVVEASHYSFVPSASDDDGDKIFFNITNKPEWAKFDNISGELSGSPTNSDIGVTKNIVINVNDGKAVTSLPPFNLQVTKKTVINGQILFSNTTFTLTEGDSVNLTVSRTSNEGAATVSYRTIDITATTGSDFNGNELKQITFLDGDSSKTVSIQSLDDQISESTETFEVRLAIPSTGYTLGANSALVTINDNDTVSNTAPVISGTPSTSVTENSAYLFIPTASDADSDSLTFSIANAPSWSTFNTTNGTLSGTPATSDIGITQGIVISVSDGMASKSLPAFNVTVASNTALTGSASLAWTIPTLKQNGDALDNLAGYTIYYGTSPGVYTDKVVVANATATTKIIDNLKANWTYYFSLTSYNTENDESEKSAEISLKITAN